DLFEHRSLLDVELQVTDGVGRGYRFAHACGVESKGANRFAYGYAFAIRRCQEIRGELSDHRQAAEKWVTEANALLVGEADNFNCESEPLPAQRLHQRDSQYHAENAIEGPRVTNGVQVRP